MMRHYAQCPVCSSNNLKFIFKAKDHTVSGEEFEVWECAACSLRFTQNIPGVEDIGRYYKAEDYISHTETKKGFINSAYLTVRKYTLQQKRKMIFKVTGMQKGKILDIGCGTGAFLEVMKSAGWDVQGLEPDDNARAIALSRGVPVSPADELFKLKEGYNSITMWHVLEHVHDLHAYIEKIRSLLLPGGVLLIAVPNYTSGDAAAYGQSWAAYDVPRHLYHFSPAAMETLMRLHGMEIIEKRPMWFDSFYVSMLSEKYSHGSNRLFSACLQGVRSNLAAVSETGKCSSVIYIIKKARS